MLNDSSVNITHANIWMWLDHKKDGFESWWSMGAFFFSKSPDTIYQRAKIQQAVNPIFSIWGDVLGFTEVFWKQQVAYISNLAEQKGYHVIAYPAFEMTSQSEDWEHLYNLIASREKIDPNTLSISSFQHPRPDFHKLVSFLEKIPLWKKWSLNGSFWYPNDNPHSVQKAHNRLLTGVLDWAIASFKLSNGIEITHGHTHGIWLNQYLDSIVSENPHILLLDANKHPSFFIRETPIFSRNYRSLIPINKETQTYMHARGWFWENIWKKVTLTHPDVAYGNELIEQTTYKIFETLSDHHGISINIKANWKKE